MATHSTDPEQLVRCLRCKLPRPAKAFNSFQDTGARQSYCLYCFHEIAMAHLKQLENRLNFLLPKGRHLQEGCKRCKAIVWWSNLDSEGRCPHCSDELRMMKLYTAPASMDQEELAALLNDIEV